MLLFFSESLNASHVPKLSLAFFDLTGKLLSPNLIAHLYFISCTILGFWILLRVNSS